MLDKDEAIEKLVDEITGRQRRNAPESDYAIDLPRQTITDVLVVSSDYDFFTLEEGGRLKDSLVKTYSRLGFSFPPSVKQVRTKDLSTALHDFNEPDLVVFFRKEGDELVQLVAQVREKWKEVRLATLSNYDDNDPGPTQESPFDASVKWMGDGRIFVKMVLFIEDKIDLERNPDPLPNDVMIWSQSLKTRSQCLMSVYEAIVQRTWDVLSEKDLTKTRRQMRRNNRPRVRSLETEDSDSIRQKVHPECILILHLESGGDPGGVLPQWAQKRKKTIMLADKDISTGGPCINPKKDFHAELKEAVSEMMGPLVIQVPSDGGAMPMEITRMSNLESFIWKVDDKRLSALLDSGKIQRWLTARNEHRLAKQFDEISALDESPAKKRTMLTDALEGSRYRFQQGVIIDYSRKSYGASTNFARVGSGALGGKARALAFLDKVLSKYVSDDLFPGLSIGIPRTVVLSTDVFTDFLESNELKELDFNNMDDERIVSMFKNADLPTLILGDLRSVIRETKAPIIVRSSSLLEDALFKPFAGVYSSVLLPNNSWETDLRYLDLCNAVKYVYASTFFEKARTYMKTTPNTYADEKMAVVIQPVAGTKRNSHFYPAVSGVARSYNYYPFPGCQPEDGIVNIAVGLGKTVVDGGRTFAFSPAKPKKNMLLDGKIPADGLQQTFFALPLQYASDVSEEGTLKELDVDEADPDVLEKTASILSHEDGKLYPGTAREGDIVINFAPLLEYGDLDISRPLNLLLKICEKALGAPVELEFALDFPDNGDAAELTILQLRTMFRTSTQEGAGETAIDPEKAIIYSEETLGNGVTQGIRHGLFVDPRKVDMAKSHEMVQAIRGFNEEMLEAGEPYILLGPGRWGSTDPWLGLPVQWSDIAGAVLIVELEMEDRHVDPSQGTHFFQNMVASGSSYMHLREHKRGKIDYQQLDDAKEEELAPATYRLAFDEPLSVVVKGKERKGAVMPRDGEVLT